MALLAGAVSAYAQGQVLMFDYGGNFAIQIFSASPSAASPVSVSYGGYTVKEQQGNTPGNDHPGATTYAGTPLGSGYDAELLAGVAGSSLGSLLPVPGSVVTSWLTGSAAGYWNSPDLLPSIPGVTTTATVAIAAWDNEGGTIDSLAAAQSAEDPWGISDTATTSALGYDIVVPPYLPGGLTSFSLGVFNLSVVPEPSTIALSVIGASALVMRLGRKK